MNEQNHVTSFAFVLGQTIGSLMRPDVKEHLKSKGVPEEKIKEFMVLAGDLAETFYK